MFIGTSATYSELKFSHLYHRTDSLYAENMIISPISGRCIVGNANYLPSPLVIVPTLFDILLLVLTVFKAVRSPASQRANAIVCAKSRLSPCGILRSNLVATYFDSGRNPVRGLASVMHLFLHNRAAGSFVAS